MRHTRIYLPLSLAALIACGPEGIPGEDPVSIYTAVIEKYLNMSSDADSLFPPLVARRTSTEFEFDEWRGDLRPYLAEHLPDLEAHTWSNFLQRNQYTGMLPQDLPLPTGARFLDIDIDTALDSPGANVFRRITETYGEPWLLLRMSEVGVNTRGDQAVVYVSVRCHMMQCGEGSYVLLSRQAGGWVVDQLVRSWVE